MNHRLFRPFRAWIGCGRAHPGALPRAGVCRAVGALGSWQASQVWGRLVGRLVDGDSTPSLESSANVGEMFSLMAPRLCVSAEGSPSGLNVTTNETAAWPPGQVSLAPSTKGCLGPDLRVGGREGVGQVELKARRHEVDHRREVPDGTEATRFPLHRLDDPVQ